MTNHYWDRVSAPHADRDASEPADRDADNAPSVEEPWREYAEAARPWMSFPSQAEDVARDCVAVEERRTAELRAENEMLRARLRATEQAVESQGHLRATAERELAAVEGTARGSRGDECTCSYYVVDYSDPERYHPENVDREDDPRCPVHGTTTTDCGDGCGCGPTAECPLVRDPAPTEDGAP